ncbi:hypothetical protein BDD43_2018 [Mucilaginibacter gracilis]|uniref:Uncharacterized protein n=1 Tax=Mucilaginibacter gracilis TaxID=423350 RepID=A0A495IYU9_9SPHI|nr:hypothetical protein [Mucilaginibacter gracilis]RKR81857.1 hypothetical protein BDD43_2018 [Mucilaginibacter gracilis]
MKKYISFFLLCGMLGLVSCKKTNPLVVDPNMPDPFTRYDNSSSTLDHQIYQVYTSTGIPLLYNDTLTKTPFNRLNIGYHLTSLDSLVTFRLSKSTDDKLAAVAFIRDQIIPALGTKLKPYSIFIVDSVFTYSISYYGKTKVMLTTYQGLNTVVIGKIGQIRSMIPDSIKTYKRDIFKSILSGSLASQTSLLTNFYAVSAAYYNKAVYGPTLTSYYLPYLPEEAYGMLAPNGVTPSVYYVLPSQATDVSQYLNVMLVLSASDFAAKYGNYPLVMTKYALLKQALISLGFTFPQ